MRDHLDLGLYGALELYKPYIIWDTGPLFGLANGVPGIIYWAVEYAARKHGIGRGGASGRAKIDVARQMVLENIVGKEKANIAAAQVFLYCLRNPDRCILAKQVEDELRGLSFSGETRNLLLLLSGPSGRSTFIAEMGKGIREANKKRTKKLGMVEPDVFEALLGRSLDWRKIDLSRFYNDMLFRAMKESAKMYYESLSSKRILPSIPSGTDLDLLAFTAILNASGIPAVLVTGDTPITYFARERGIPYILTYSGTLENEGNLGSLHIIPEFQPLLEKYKTLFQLAS